MSSPDKPPHQDTPAPEAAAHDELGFELPPPYQPTRTRTWLFVLGGVAVIGCVFLAGFLPKLRARSELEARAGQHAPVKLEVVKPTLLPEVHTLRLPASVQPLAETTIYPRANGYVRKYFKDLGDHVREGEVMADIDAPELDQQLIQARAMLLQVRAASGQTEAQRDLAHLTLERYRALAPRGVTSQQEVDQYAGQAQVADANLRAAEAAVQVQEAEVARLSQLKAFTRVTAPFAGKVIARSVDVGSLLSAGNATPMFRIASSDIVRVFIDVPQDTAASVKVGADAEIIVREFPGRPFAGRVAHVAGALDDATRTMRTEVRAANVDGTLMPGMFADVALALKLSHPVHELPASALVSDAQGVRVVSVGKDGKIHYLPVTIERDTGATVQLSAGLTGDEQIVRLATPTLREGQAVRAEQHREAQGPSKAERR